MERAEKIKEFMNSLLNSSTIASLTERTASYNNLSKRHRRENIAL